MSKPRINLSRKLRESVEYASDMQCCICRSPGHHIHHIDGDPKNNDFDNLALLCFDHHNLAETKGGLAVNWTPGLIVRYREDWYRIVKAGRSREMPAETPGPPVDGHPDFPDMLAAIEVHEIRRIGFELIDAEWQKTGVLLSRLRFYAHSESWRLPYVGLEVINSLDSAADRLRHDLPSEFASEIVDVASEALPVSSLVGKAYRKPTEAEITTLEQGIELGRLIAYDGARYLGLLSVVDAGSRLLWKILRFARLNDLGRLMESARDGFISVIQTAKQEESEFPDAARWLEYRMEDAEAIQQPYPSEPEDLIVRLQRKWHFLGRLLSDGSRLPHLRFQPAVFPPSPSQCPGL